MYDRDLARVIRHTWVTSDGHCSVTNVWQRLTTYGIQLQSVSFAYHNHLRCCQARWHVTAHGSFLQHVTALGSFMQVEASLQLSESTPKYRHSWERSNCYVRQTHKYRHFLDTTVYQKHVNQHWNHIINMWVIMSLMWASIVSIS